jgi:ABC-type transporter Mla subunit MlaD
MAEALITLADIARTLGDYRDAELSSFAALTLGIAANRASQVTRAVQAVSNLVAHLGQASPAAAHAILERCEAALAEYENSAGPLEVISRARLAIPNVNHHKS